MYLTVRVPEIQQALTLSTELQIAKQEQQKALHNEQSIEHIENSIEHTNNAQAIQRARNTDGARRRTQENDTKTELNN